MNILQVKNEETLALGNFLKVTYPEVTKSLCIHLVQLTCYFTVETEEIQQPGSTMIPVDITGHTLCMLTLY